MSRRYLQIMVSVLAMGVMLSVVPAHAQSRVRGTAGTPDLSVTWTFGPSSPFLGTRFDGASIAGRVYFLGFRTTANATDGSVWYFDVATQTYVDTNVDMKVPVSNYGIAVLQDATGTGLYIFGGRSGTGETMAITQVYYPATNASKIIQADPWPGTTPSACVSLPAMGIATVQNKAYALGGMSFSTSVPPCIDDQSAQTWVFDPLGAPGSRWTPGPNLIQPRGYITPAVLGSRIFAIGGDVNNAGVLVALKKVEAWDVTTAAWTDAPRDLPVACDESQAFPRASGPGSPAIILGGCGQWPNALPLSLIYDATTNTWAQGGNLNENRRNHAGAQITVAGQPRLYILGGYGEVSTFIEPIDTSEIGALGPFATPHGRGSLGQGSRYATTN